jgi:hypothetical protein
MVAAFWLFQQAGLDAYSHGNSVLGGRLDDLLDADICVVSGIGIDHAGGWVIPARVGCIRSWHLPLAGHLPCAVIWVQPLLDHVALLDAPFFRAGVTMT